MLLFLSLAITNASVGKSFDPLKKSLGTVSRSNYNRCITSQGTYTLSITGRGKVASVVYKIAYIPNKYINGEIKNLKKSKVNDGVILLTGKVPKVGEAFAVALMLENKEIDAMISKLKKVKKSGKPVQITFHKVSGAPYSYTVSTWDGKTIMRKSYKYVKNKSTHKMIVKKANIVYGKK